MDTIPPEATPVSESQSVFHDEGTPVTVTVSVSWTATTSCCRTRGPPPEATPVTVTVFHGQYTT